MAYVALDYGHGRNTWEKGGGKGVRHGGKVYEEHDFNADVGERVRKILQAHGVKVLVTQPAQGNEVSLSARTNKANRAGVDLFVSFHANAGVASASGACVFAWKGSSKGAKIQDLIVRNLKAQGIDLHGNGKHISQRGSWTNFHVVRETKMPAVLIEHGFMTNARDFDNIFGKNKEAYRQKCAIADAKAILAYFGIKYDSGKSKGKASGDWKAYKPTPEDYKRGRIGRVKITTPRLNFREGKSLDSKIIKVLGGGGIYYCYDVDGKWHNLGGGWASAGSKGDLLEFVPFPPQPKEPKKSVYRVIVNGEQVGAYAEDSNVLAQAKKALADGDKSIVIEKV